MVGNPDASVNPSLMNIQSAAVSAEDFKHCVPPQNILRNRQGLVIQQNRAD